MKKMQLLDQEPMKLVLNLRLLFVLRKLRSVLFSTVSSKDSIVHRQNKQFLSLNLTNSIHNLHQKKIPNFSCQECQNSTNLRNKKPRLQVTTTLDKHQNTIWCEISSKVQIQSHSSAIYLDLLSKSEMNIYLDPEHIIVLV